VAEVGARSNEAGGNAAGGKEAAGWKLEAREIYPDAEKRKKPQSTEALRLYSNFSVGFRTRRVQTFRVEKAFVAAPSQAT
jgi:hypothetical protein